MIKKAVFCSVLLIGTSLHAQDILFGKLTLQESSAKSIKDAVAQFKDGAESTQIVKGTVTKVCEEKGCWMSLEDQGQNVRVFFKNYSFFVSNKITDKAVLVEGTLLRKIRSVAEQKHLAKDSGASKDSIAAIKDAKAFFEFEATGIKAI
jgi:hypothetical protein